MDAPLLVASSRTHAPPSDSSSIRRSTAIYMSYAVAHLVILGCWIAPWGGEWLWTAGSHQWSHNPEAVNSNASTRDGFAAASKIVLTLVEVSLVWDNFIVGVGRSVLAKCGIDVLRRASYPRFLAHAALTPLLLIVVASRADRAGGVPWLNCAGGCAAAAAAGLYSATDSAEANSVHCSGTIGMWVLLGIGVALAVVGLVHFFLTFDELAIAGSSQISNSQISAAAVTVAAAGDDDDDDDDDDDERKPKLPPPQKKKCAALTKLGSGLVRFTASEPKPKQKPPQGEDPSFCRRKGVTLAIMIGPAVFVVLVAIVVGLWIAAGDRERPRDQLTSLPTIAGIVLAVCSFIMFGCAAGPPVFTLFSGNFGEVVLAMGLVASGRLLMLP